MSEAPGPESTEPSTPGPSTKGCLVSVGVILALFVGCVALSDDGDSERTGPSDASASVACRHFRNIVGDAPMMTDAELREKLQEVETSASVAESPTLRDAARDMVIEVTRGTTAGFEDAVGRFGNECRRLGG